VLFRSKRGGGTPYHLAFLGLVVINMVAAFQALGTLMAVGLMMLPAIAARAWSRSLPGMMLAAVLIAMLSGYGGLLLSYHGDLPSGPAIVLAAGALYIVSLAIGRVDGLLPRLRQPRHFEA
jgi:zinc/manganese transport system permease protein